MTHQLNLGVLPIESGEPTNGHGCVQHVVDLVEPLVVEENDEIILSTDKGSVMRCAVKEIRTAGRNTQGVRIIKLSGDEKVVSAIKIDDNLA